MLWANPMLDCNAARLFGPPPATVLMEYCPDESWGSPRVMTKTRTIAGLSFDDFMAGSPFRQQGDPDGRLRCRGVRSLSRPLERFGGVIRASIVHTRPAGS